MADTQTLLQDLIAAQKAQVEAALQNAQAEWRRIRELEKQNTLEEERAAKMEELITLVETCSAALAAQGDLIQTILQYIVNVVIPALVIRTGTMTGIEREERERLLQLVERIGSTHGIIVQAGHDVNSGDLTGGNKS